MDDIFDERLLISIFTVIINFITALLQCVCCMCLPCSVFFGPMPVYFITDLDLVKEITVKHFDKFADRLGGVSPIQCVLDSMALSLNI